jgi:hypothetical protein
MWVWAQIVRNKDDSTRTYLHLVQSRRVNGRVRQEIISTLGWLDVLQGSGALEAVRKLNFSRNFLIFYEQNFLKQRQKRYFRTASVVECLLPQLCVSHGGVKFGYE